MIKIVVIAPAGYEIALIAMLVSVATNIINKLLVDQNKLEEIRKKQKEYNKKLMQARKKNDEKEMKKLESENKEMMQLMAEQMKMSFKPMIYTFIPIILIFWYIRSTYEGLGQIVTGLPVLGSVGWLGWYIIISITTFTIFEQIYKQVRKRKKIVPLKKGED